MTTTDDIQVTPAVDMITGVIDGVEISVPKGTLIIRAAEQMGIAIPRFCDHPLLDPVGACRQCLVDVAMPGPDGSMRPMPKPQPACAMELGNGMQVNTQETSEVAGKAQAGVMEFLLINHPLDCPVCDKGGECPLQNQAMSNGGAESRFKEVKRTFPKPIKISTQVLLDRERCVLCQRCTRFSKQIAGDAFIDLQMRGARQQIGAFDPDVLGIHTEGDSMIDESGQPFASYFSGNTIQICPVGALTSASYRFRSRPFDLVSTPSICEQCAIGCSTRTDHRRGTILRRLSGNDPEVNEEWLCDKGRFAFRWPHLDDRLTSPLVRDAESGELREASWPEAIEVAAAGLAAARDGGFVQPDEDDEDAPEARGVGVLTGGQLTLEDSYAYSKFTRTVLSTNNIDMRARIGSQEETHFVAKHVAGRTVHESVTLPSLEAAPAVLLVACEPEEEAPILFLRLRKANRQNNTMIYSLAPYATRSLQKMNGELIPAAPGTEVTVLNAIATGHDEAEAVSESLRRPGSVLIVGERAAELPGVLSAVSELSATTGARILWVPRRIGERGAIEAGCLPQLLPGGRTTNNATDLETRWSTSLPTEDGLDTVQMVDAAAGGRLGALIIAGVDAKDMPDQDQFVRALDRVPFVVSLEVRRTAITDIADVVFPVAPPVERSGTYLNFESRPRPFDVALTANTMTDTRVLAALARQLDSDLGFHDTAGAQIDFAAIGQAPVTTDLPSVSVAVPTAPTAGSAVVSTWHALLDNGTLQDGEPYLAGTAHRSVARLSEQTARDADVLSAEAITITGERGSTTLPLVITDMVDGVIWLPTSSNHSNVRALGIKTGSVVSFTAAPPLSGAPSDMAPQEAK